MDNVREESESNFRCRFSIGERIQLAIVGIAVVLVLVTIALTPVIASAQSSPAYDYNQSYETRDYRTAYIGIQGGKSSFFGDTDECAEILEEIDEASEGADSRVSDAIAQLVSGGDCEADDSDTAFRIYAGYQFNPWFAMELSVADLGSSSAMLSGSTVVDGITINGQGNVEASVKGIGLDAIVSIPLAPRFSIFGRIGVLAWDADLDATAGGRLTLGDNALELEDVSQSEGDSGADVVYGGGIKVGVTQNLNIRAEFTRYEVVDVDVGWLGVEFEL